ncbi:hypothetical protein [Mycobacterium vicinigordonae]|uniref:Integral membrane protein n=1 Tax=Mycobacterium vicinigordonae TaxID=1719132 RepID=A0A7D6HWN9_9MYCO|nr:hypothetical protein [Mycobacterium vicinigordonae]QLL08673.1 hypothetical protein H0P51_07065 [Mycobacterium vicinigordonae]
MPAVAQQVVSTAFGLAMVGLVAVGSDGATLVVVAAAAAGLVVGLGTMFRSAATGAVLLAVLVVVLSDPPHILVALSGLCAAAYLVSRHLAGSWPTAVAAVGFTFVGLVATSFPLQVPWLPLLAPLAVLAIYVVATRPFLT